VDEPLGQEGLAGADEVAQLSVAVHLTRVRVEHDDVTWPGGLQRVGVTSRQRHQVLRYGIRLPGGADLAEGQLRGRNEVRKPRHRDSRDRPDASHLTNVGTLAVCDRSWSVSGG